jgi:MFS family permease
VLLQPGLHPKQCKRTFSQLCRRLVSDKLLASTKNLNVARRNLAAVMMVLCCVSMIPILFTNNLVIVVLAPSAGFFCAEFTIGPMWAIPMDIAPKFSGTASGIMNTGSAVATIVSPLVFGYIVDRTGHWIWPFMGSMALMLVGRRIRLRDAPGSSACRFVVGSCIPDLKWLTPDDFVRIESRVQVVTLRG